MEVIGRSFSVLCPTPSLSARRRFCTTLAKKKDVQDNNDSQLPLTVSKSNLARAAIGVFGLGFIDAG
jgi:hypothetical protein